MMHKKHIVMAGENLSVIARKNELPGWHALYYANENKEFRRKNPNPDQIFPGQTIVIPPNKIQIRQNLQSRLAHLKRTKLSAQQMFNEQRETLTSDLNEIKRSSDTVDAIATVATLMVSLAQTTWKGAQIMKLEGEAAEKAVKEFGTGALKDRGKNVRDLAAQVVSKTESDTSNVAWLVTKSVAQSWCDITSPSFWGNTFVNLWNEDKSWSEAVTTKPEDVFEKSLIKLNATKSRVIQDLDKKIREIELELIGLNKPPLA